jgi:hypothetical protein
MLAARVTLVSCLVRHIDPGRCGVPLTTALIGMWRASPSAEGSAPRGGDV